MKTLKSFLIYSLFMVIVFSSCGQKTKNSQASMENLPKNETEWKKKLSAEEFYILRQKGTESPYTGKFLMHKEKGIYTCKGCGAHLFTSDSKFDSHCGWPSFDKEIKAGVIKETRDLSHGMDRIEITCAKCGGHLGHVFNDGPTDTGLRYCVNSVSLGFESVK